MESFNFNNSENKLNSIGFFSNGEHFVYIFKKTERIVQALYLTTQHIKDDEPLKIEIRELSLSMLDNAFSLNSVESYDGNVLLSSFFSNSLKIISFLSTASVSSLISKVNSSIIKNEIESIITLLRNKIKEDVDRSGFVLSKDFFATENMTFNKGHIFSDSRTDIGHIKDNKRQGLEDNRNKDINIKDKKNNRQDIIINFLKKENQATIKDFLKVIVDCSEKTIQRELIDMVKKGIVKREGERRWSKYSLY